MGDRFLYQHILWGRKDSISSMFNGQVEVHKDHITLNGSQDFFKYF